MDEGLKFVTPDGGLRKTAKNFLFFLQTQFNFKTFLD